MGRRVPFSSPSEAHPSLHLMLTVSFTALLVTASIAIIATLCASCHRSPSPEEQEQATKPGPSSPQSNGSMHEEAAAPPPTPPATSTDDHNHEQNEKVVLDVDLHGPIPPSTVAPAEPRRRLSMNLSFKIPEGLARIRTARKERHGKAAAAVDCSDDDDDGDERIWKKTIILGEKCRVPSEDEEEGRRRNYHPRTPRSLPVSRTNSFVKPDHLAHHTPF